MPTKEEIEKLAYILWEQDGKPVGRDLAHYFEAERILKEREQPAHRPPGRPRAAKGTRKTAVRTGRGKAGQSTPTSPTRQPT